VAIDRQFINLQPQVSIFCSFTFTKLPNHSDINEVETE